MSYHFTLQYATGSAVWLAVFTVTGNCANYQERTLVSCTIGRNECTYYLQETEEYFTYDAQSLTCVQCHSTATKGA